MDQEYVPYEIALELKQLGFDEYCMGACYYEWKDRGKTKIMLHTPDEYDSHDGVKAPLFQQAFRFFREKYGLLCYIRKVGSYWYNIDAEDGSTLDNQFEGRFDTYEEAELTCLRKLIEIVKEK